jgi:single-stranded-DNA-specific exonuclease
MEQIKNLKKAKERIEKAIKNDEKIIIYADADLDGVTSAVILKETIKNLGGKILTVYFPDREKDGYGLNKNAISFLKKFSPALLIVLDLGIGNFEEVELAKKSGFEIIIIDHHEILGKVPKADIVVDPKQKGDEYPFKDLATVGIVFKLSEILLKERMSQELRKSFLELVALGTIADFMPQEEENEIFIKEGIESIQNSFRPGIRAFFEIEDFEKLDLNQKISKFVSILNVRESEKSIPHSFKLFTSSSIEEGKALIESLLEKKEERKKKVKEILEEIEKKLKNEKLIFEGSENWDFSTLGSVASHLVKKYKKPVFIFKKLEKESVGTVRSPPKINSVALMSKCKKYLLTFGGHPQASGFRIKNENLEKFKKCLNENLK